jgi:tripartite-type tricarboxylate transporter receptor subunit TctC
MIRFRAALLVPLALIGLMVTPTQASAADFYSGKTVSIIVGFSPGGGYDLYARAVARYLGRYVPGHPTVIVQNMPSAGSLKAVRALDATEPKDGTILTVFNNGLVTQSIVEPETVDLDFRKFAWVGVVTPDFRVCYGFGDNGPRNWNEMMHRTRFILGATGKGSDSYINGAILRHVFHAPIKQIVGFPGSAEQRLAIERGELDGDCGSFSSIPIAWVRDGAAHAFVRFTRERPSEIPESAADITTFAETEMEAQLLAVLDAGNEVGRPFIMSQKVPLERIAIMRKAFDDVMKDDGFLSDMKKQQLPVHPLTSQQAEETIAKVSNVSAELRAEAKKIYE